MGRSGLSLQHKARLISFMCSEQVYEKILLLLIFALLRSLLLGKMILRNTKFFTFLGNLTSKCSLNWQGPPVANGSVKTLGARECSL